MAEIQDMNVEDDTNVSLILNEEKKIMKRDKVLAHRLLKINEGEKWLKVGVWNLQSLNIDINRRYQKLEFIRDCFNDNPYDIIWLIDVNDRNNCLILNGYNKFTDNRSILYVKSNLVIDFKISRNIIYSEEAKLAFVYVVPNCYDKVLINNFVYLIRNKYVVCGDINIKSNRQLWPYINYFHGEDSMQTGFISNKVIKVFTKSGPSDHRLISGYIKVHCKFNYSLKFSQLSIDYCNKCVEDILRGKVPEFKPKVSIRRSYVGLNDRENSINAMINDYINHDIRKVYKRYNYLWCGDRKEPFLGMQVPNCVKESFAEHLHENNDKVYKDMQVMNISKKFVDEIMVKGTKSKALNADYLQLNSICDTIRKVIKSKEYDRESLFMNICKVANLTKESIDAQTFFLVKNAKLKDFNDVRVIVIIPTLVKIYEACIYDSVLEYFTKYFAQKPQYQFGALPGKSTYLGICKLRSDYEINDGDAVIFLDIAKGYDCLELSILERYVNEYVSDSIIRALLLNWIILIGNLNYIINGERVKRTRGIAMGLSLSPIIFVFYVDIALKKFDKELMSMFIDDLGLVKPRVMSVKNFINLFEDIIKELQKAHLVVNRMKTGLLTKNEELKKEMKEVEILDKEKYLGRLIGITADGKIMNDDRWYNTKSFRSQCIPYWASFFVKKLIYNTCLDARVRYRFMMWACSDIKTRDSLWRNTWFFLKSNFAKFSYLEVSFSMFNIFRYCIDGNDIRNWENRIARGEDKAIITKEVKNRLYITNKNEDVFINKAIDDMNINLEFKGEDYFHKCANFCDNMFGTFKKNMIKYYIIKQKTAKNVVDREIFENLEIFCNSPLFSHFGFLHSVIFKHVEKKKRNKQILVYIVLRSLLFIVDEWENFKGGISKEFVDANKALEVTEDVARNGKNKFEVMLDLGKKEWELAIIKLYKECWKIVDCLLEIVAFTKEKVKEEDDIDWKNLNNVVYVDGSFSNGKGGYGIFFEKPFVYEISGKVESEYGYLRNVAGELIAATNAIDIAIQKGLKEINLVYDYTGVFNYLEENWSTKDKNIREWIAKFRNQKKLIDVNFIKVPSHTNNFGNSRADALAKIGAGIEVKKDPECKHSKKEKEIWKNVYGDIFKIFTCLELLLYNNNINDYTLEQLAIALKIKHFSIKDLGEKIFKLTDFSDLDNIDPSCMDAIF